MKDGATQTIAEEPGGLLLLAPLILGAAAAAVIVLTVFANLTADADFALGRDTSAIFGRVNDYPINSRHGEDLDEVVAGWRERGERPVVLWFGNSQLHGINQYEEGQVNAPLILHRRADAQGLDVLTFSPPSANLVEHYLLFETLRQRFPVKAVIQKASFINQRWTNVRSELQTFLRTSGPWGSCSGSRSTSTSRPTPTSPSDRRG